jgi:hypothetical protein
VALLEARLLRLVRVFRAWHCPGHCVIA